LGALLAGGVLAAVLARGGDTAAPTVATTGAMRTVATGTVAVSFSGGCPRARSSLARPSDFPRNFPLPDGTVLTSVQRPERRSASRTLYLVGFAPLRLEAAVRFFRDVPARHGFRSTWREVDPSDAETHFVGRGISGATKVAALMHCDTATWLLVGVTLAARS
jgi:hypothetical protein